MRINLKSKQQIYLEIYESIKKHITLGILSVGEKLPSVRMLAKDLGINPNTVDRAYNLLESEGLITILPQKGAFISGIESKHESEKYIHEIKELKNRGASREELFNAIKIAYMEENE